MVVLLAIVITLFLVVIASIITMAVSALGVQWMRMRRKMRAMASGATDSMIWPEEYQPRTVGKAWRAPVEFAATRPCLHCGFHDTHNMAAPSKQDHPDASTIRRCKRCGHIWGEK